MPKKFSGHTIHLTFTQVHTVSKITEKCSYYLKWIQNFKTLHKILASKWILYFSFIKIISELKRFAALSFCYAHKKVKKNVFLFEGFVKLYRCFNKFILRTFLMWLDFLFNGDRYTCPSQCWSFARWGYRLCIRDILYSSLRIPQHCVCQTLDTGMLLFAFSPFPGYVQGGSPKYSPREGIDFMLSFQPCCLFWLSLPLKYQQKTNQNCFQNLIYFFNLWLQNTVFANVQLVTFINGSLF